MWLSGRLLVQQVESLNFDPQHPTHTEVVLPQLWGESVNWKERTRGETFRSSGGVALESEHEVFEQ